MSEKTERQLIQNLLSELDSDNKTPKHFQELLSVLKKNSKPINQFVVENFWKFLKVVETEMEQNEINPSAFTCYGFLSHHEVFCKHFTSTQMESFFTCVLKHINVSKKSLALSVWCLGVQRFSLNETNQNPIRKFSSKIFDAIHYAINNPFQSVTTICEALNTLLVMIGQLQEVSIQYFNIWIVDVIDCLLHEQKNICLAADKIMDHYIVKNSLSQNPTDKYKISENDLKETSKKLAEISTNLLQKLQKSFQSKDNDIQLISIKAWGFIVYLLQKKIMNETITNPFLDLIRTKLKTNKENKEVDNKLVCDAIEHAWTFLINNFIMDKKFHTSKGKFTLVVKPLILHLSNNTDKKLREICFKKIIYLILPVASKNFTMVFENIGKIFFDCITKEPDTSFQEQLILFLSNWISNKNDISLLIQKEYTYLFSSPCLKADAFGPESCEDNDKLLLLSIQKLEFIEKNFKYIFEGFLEKIVNNFIQKFNEENAKSLSSVLNIYYRSLCLMIGSYCSLKNLDEKLTNILRGILTRLLRFCVENIKQSFCDNAPLTKEQLGWTQEISLSFIKSFIDIIPLHVLLKFNIDINQITGIPVLNSNKSLIISTIYFLLESVCKSPQSDKLRDLVVNIFNSFVTRVLGEDHDLPSLYCDSMKNILPSLLDELIQLPTELQRTETDISPLVSIFTQIWKSSLKTVRNELKTTEICFSMLENKNIEKNISSELLHKRKTLANNLKNYLSTNIDKNLQKNLSANIIHPDFFKTLLSKLLFYPFDIFAKLFYNNIINSLDNEMYSLWKESILIYANILNGYNSPPINHINKQLKSNLKHVHLQTVVNELSDKVQVQYVEMLTNELTNKKQSNESNNTYGNFVSWFEYGSKLLLIICQTCHECQRYDVQILSTPSGKETIHNLLKILKHFIWMMFDFKKQVDLKVFPNFEVDLMYEMKNLLTLSKNSTHSIEFALQFAEEILFEGEFTKLFEMKRNTNSGAAEDMLKFGNLCENCWESVLNLLSKWCLQDGVNFDNSLLQKIEKIFILGFDLQRSAKIRKMTVNFWNNTFCNSKSNLNYSEGLKKVILELVDKEENGKEKFPNFIFPQKQKVVDKMEDEEEEENEKKRKRNSEVNLSSTSTSYSFLSNNSSKLISPEIQIKKETTKKAKLTESQKSKIREQRDTRIVFPGMNPSLLSPSDSLLSGDSTDDDIKSPKKEVINISDVLMPSTSKNIKKEEKHNNNEEESETISIISTPKKESTTVNLVTPIKKDETTTPSMEELFGKLESTPKLPSNNVSPSITFSINTNCNNPIESTTNGANNNASKAATAVERKLFTDHEVHTSSDKYPLLITPIRPNVELKKEEDLEDKNDMEKLLSQLKTPKKVRFGDENSSNNNNSGTTTGELSIMDRLKQVEKMIQTKETGKKVFQSSQERKEVTKKLYDLLGLLIDNND
ncbi:hypothetical protein ABK040_007708 [Willaertia magna]